MANKISLLLCCIGLYFIQYLAAQMITQPPESTTAALGTNVTFSCRGIGRVLWQINQTQIQADRQVSAFATMHVFVPLPSDDFSELIVTATRETNATQEIRCVVEPYRMVGGSVESDPVQLLVYAEPNPPVDLSITVDGLNLVAAWNEPFLLEGEVVSYVIFITNKASGVQDEVKTNAITYVLSEPIGGRDCAEYMFTISSNNNYSTSMTNISGYERIPTVPVVIKRSDVWINVSLIEDIQIIISFNPGDPCPAYPVVDYTFNIFEDSSNFTATMNHTGNTSVNINGSMLGLQRDQIYQLIIEATNIVGSTSSEKVDLYTTGLQSSFAVPELNGSITITCTFATGATSTGCQVTILMDNLQVFSTIIVRSIRVTQVSMTIDMIENYSTLLIHTADVLSGGNVNHNVNFSQTINHTVMATSTVIPGFTMLSTSATPVSLQVPSEFIIIVALLCAVLVLMMITTIIVSAIFFVRARRKSGRHDLSNQGKDILTTPAYESVEIDDETCSVTLQNPIYNDNVNITPTSETAGTTLRLRQVPETLQIQTHNGDPDLDPRTNISHDLTSSPTTHVSYHQSPPSSPSKIDIKEHYEMQEINRVHRNARDSDVLKEFRGESKIHTDPLTGYSTLCRPDKSQPTSNQVPFYESVKVKNICLHSDAEHHQYSTLNQDSDPPLTTSHTSSHNSVKGECPVQSQTLPTMKHIVPTDPETGYSSMLRPDKVIPPSGPVPPYDVISVQHKDAAVTKDTNVALLGSHTSSSISFSHNSKVQEPDLPPESMFD